jgi:hypothetical protein
MALKQYREKVKEFLADCRLTDFENIQLDLLKEELELSVEEAKKILEEEQAPIRQAQQAYKRMLNALIGQGLHPFNDEIRNDLKKFQAEKNLTDEEVEQISKPILEAAEVEHQGKLRQRYEQEFKQVIEAGYPVDEVARDGLKNLQQSLGLKGEDVTLIEQPILEKAELARQDTDDLRSEKGVDYTQLRDLLKAGQWEEADRETVNVMLKVTGRVSEGWLDQASIENFPCTDLRTIDQLWVKYSKGRFGFSVQKRIFDSVNREEGYFGERVGWRKGFFVWKTYQEITYTLEAPKGHLPTMYRFYSVILVGRSVDGRLFSRVETCKV